MFSINPSGQGNGLSQRSASAKPTLQDAGGSKDQAELQEQKAAWSGDSGTKEDYAPSKIDGGERFSALFKAAEKSRYKTFYQYLSLILLQHHRLQYTL